MLVDDMNTAIREGSHAVVHATHLRSASKSQSNKTPVREVLEPLLEAAAGEVRAEERSYLSIVEERIRSGSLSERITQEIRRRGRRMRTDRASEIRSVYDELADCLESNRPWSP
jgi:hypothetical protein